MARHRNGDLTEAEQTIFRSGLGKLIWVARIARTGAIYGASAATRTFAEGEMIDSIIAKGDFPENEEKGDPQRERRILSTRQVSGSFYKQINRMSMRRTF